MVPGEMEMKRWISDIGIEGMLRTKWRGKSKDDPLLFELETMENNGILIWIEK